MTHVRITAAIVTAAIALVTVAHISDAAAATDIPVDVAVTFEPIVALAEIDDTEVVDDTEVIDGVRIIADNPDHTALATTTVAKFADAGWAITNTEIRFDDDACDDTVGFHTEEHGHHVVVMCTNAPWTLLHELGHVWSDLYLDDTERSQWLTKRGVASWSDGPWGERGTEHAADIIAFGLNDTMHMPTGIGDTDYQNVVDSFEWLFGIPPLHRHKTTTAEDELSNTPRFHLVSPVHGIVDDAG